MLHHPVKSNSKTQWFLMKVAAFWNNKKKDWFSLEAWLVFVHWDAFKDRSRNYPTFKIELRATVSSGRVYNQWAVVFVYCCGNSTIFTGKIEIRWTWLCLEGSIRYNILFCRHVFTKTPITFFFTNILFHFEN